MNILSPYNPNNSWASMVNTPMIPNFNTQQQSAAHADMVASATAMKLAALSTVNNRIQLDDVKKFRRARSNEGQPQYQQQQQQNMNILMTNELGQVLTPQQAAALQAQQLAALQQQGGRSRPSSPGIAISGPPGSNMNHLPMTQNNGFLSTYDAGLLNANMGALNMGNFGMGGHEGYLSDHSEARGRSPRGRRGSSKPPEDPTKHRIFWECRDCL